MEFQKVPNFAQKIQKNGFLGSVWGGMTFWRFQSWKLLKMLPFPEKKFWPKFLADFGQNRILDLKNRKKSIFFKFCLALYPSKNSLEKKAFGALGSLCKRFKLLKPKKTKMVYFWFLRCLKIAKIALNQAQKFLRKNNF